MSNRFTGHDPASGRDTGGVPWQGRTLTGTGFDQDTGEVDSRLAGLLASVVASGGGPSSGEGAPEGAAERELGAERGLVGERELVAAVAAARLIVPILAVPSEVDESSGQPVDAVSDMASVTLVAPDGQQALPAFTSTAALAAWDPTARPVPVTAQRAALAAVQEGCDVIPLDLPAPPGSAAYTLRPSMVWALAQERTWVPAHEDELVARAVADAVAAEPAVAGHRVGAGPGGQLQITLALRPGLTQAQLQILLGAVGERIAADPDTRTRIDAVVFRLTAVP